MSRVILRSKELFRSSEVQRINSDSTVSTHTSLNKAVLHCPFVQGQTNNHSDQTDQQCETARHSERLTLALKEARAENDRLKLTNSELEAQLQAARNALGLGF